MSVSSLLDSVKPKKNVDRRGTKKTKNTVHFFVRKMREKRRENAKGRRLAGGNIDPAASRGEMIHRSTISKL